MLLRPEKQSPAGSFFLCQVCDANRRRLKWVGSKTDLRLRKTSKLIKGSSFSKIQGGEFVSQYWSTARNVTLTALKGGPSGRGHDYFTPPEGDVVEEQFDKEEMVVKKHFVFLEIYKAEVGACKDNQFLCFVWCSQSGLFRLGFDVERPSPNLGRQTEPH